MKGIVGLILGVVFFGIVVLLCLFSCFLSNNCKDYWAGLKRRFEENENDRC